MREAMIKVRGLLGVDEEGGDIELVSHGSYEYGEGETRFSYEESELTGMEGTTTRFSVTPEGVTLTREGTVSMQLMFEEGRKNYFAYNTPFGAFTMGIDTLEIVPRFSEDGGTLEVRYIIDTPDLATVRTAFTVEIRAI